MQNETEGHETQLQFFEVRHVKIKDPNDWEFENMRFPVILIGVVIVGAYQYFTRMGGSSGRKQEYEEVDDEPKRYEPRQSK